MINDFHTVLLQYKRFSPVSVKYTYTGKNREKNLSLSPKSFEKNCVFLKMSTFFSTWANHSPMLTKQLLIQMAFNSISNNITKIIRHFFVL